MALNFKELKQARSTSFLALQAEVEKKAEYGAKDVSYWQPTVDKAGNGFAIIRFLPEPANEALPFVKLFTHAFKGPTGKWFIENSRTTIGESDPVSEYNSELWAVSEDDDSPTRKQARDQKRKLTYISNIYVIKDSGNPENEGKVFRYKYGKKIYDKINAKMFPEFEGDAKFNPFDLWEGADFKVKIRQVAGFRNYDASEFAAPAPLFKDDDAMEAVWQKCYPLAELIAPDKFKSYEELKAQLTKVLGGTAAPTARTAEEAAPTASYAPRARTAAAPSAPEAVSEEIAAEGDDLSYFEKLAQE